MPTRPFGQQAKSRFEANKAWLALMPLPPAHCVTSCHNRTDAMQGMLKYCSWSLPPPLLDGRAYASFTALTQEEVTGERPLLWVTLCCGESGLIPLSPWDPLSALHLRSDHRSPTCLTVSQQSWEQTSPTRPCVPAHSPFWL